MGSRPQGQVSNWERMGHELNQGSGEKERARMLVNALLSMATTRQADAKAVVGTVMLGVSQRAAPGP